MILSLSVGLCLIYSQAAQAQEIRFEATVDSNVVELGSTFQLTLTISGTQDVAPIKIPDIEGLETRYLGPSTQVFISNGKTSTAISFMYTVYPSGVGKFQIPALQIDLKGETYTSHPVDITVVDPQDSSSSRLYNSTQAIRIEDKIYIVMGMAKTDVYLYEQVPLTVRMFVKDISVKDFQYPEFDHVGFNAESFQKPNHYQKIIGGVQFDIVDFNTYIYPTRVGQLTLGPARLLANILYKKSRNRRTGQFGNIFDDDFFEGFFNTYDVKPYTLEAKPLTVNVMPLPEEGKPENFSGGVGDYHFDVSVSPAKVNVGDPVTVRMSISGTGNLSSITLPSFKENRNFKFYDQQVSEEEGTKIVEQVVIPLNDRVSEIPAIEFAYFDTSEKIYKTIPKGPFPVEVSNVQGREELKIVGLEPRAGLIYDRQEILGRDISFIKDSPGRFKKRGHGLYHSGVFFILLILLAIAWAGLFAFISFTHRLKTDIKFARRLKAPHQARRGLKEAKALLKEDGKSFYECLFKTLVGYFSNRFHVPLGVITSQYVSDAASKSKRGAQIKPVINAVFSECEMVRYASVNIDESKMLETLRNAEILIDFFERNL